MPLKYLNSLVFIDLLNAITNVSLKNKLKNAIIKIDNDCNKNTKNTKNNDKTFDYANIEKCRTLIKSKIMIPKNKMIIELPDVTITNIAVFNSDIIHNIIYLIQILRKYSNVFIPYQKFLQDKSIDMLSKNKELNAFTTDYGYIIYDFINTYTYNFFEFLPHLILWKDDNAFYNYVDLDYYIRKALRGNNVRFILFKLTLIPYKTMVHANIVIYDKKLNKVERFEPYGSARTLMESSVKLDIYLKKLFKKNINNDILYYGPNDFMTESKFQLQSLENDLENRKLTDPIGFCLAWCFWYIELRLSNPEIDPKTLVDEALHKIINDENNKNINKTNSNNVLLAHIRNYSKKLDEYKINFYNEIGINVNDNYKLKQSSYNQELIVSHAIESFNKLVTERYNINS